MERITRKQVDTIAGHVSALLPKGTFVAPFGVNGGIQLDLCYMEPGEGRNEMVVRTRKTLCFGTKREVYTFAHAMREGILLSREG